ncbi:MAG: Vitamin B12 dependent methionine synthase activation subunit [Lachnospiraceae bacterium]|nr:Vitamin B12 dependent methionine synthase activation subunit [Lachnospiraceae bacterium]
MSLVRYAVNASELNIRESEVLRYLGYDPKLVTEADLQMVQNLREEVIGKIAPKAVYDRFRIELPKEGVIDMPYGRVVSKDLYNNLKGCEEVYIFAATIGAEYDRLVKRSSIRSMANAAVINSIGATAVEELCDMLNEMLRLEALEEGHALRPRYSPGYGDLALENQKGIFSVLLPEKNLSLTLKDNLIMAPEKSVTAIIGIV